MTQMSLQTMKILKMKSYITRHFKKFMKNANAKGFDKDRKQSSSS